MPIPSNNAVRAWRALDRSPNQLWVEWATQRLVAGDDTTNLRILAGLREPFDHLETFRLTDRILAELNVPALDRTKAVEAYAEELLNDLLERRQPIDEVLAELANLCIEAGYYRGIYPFYLLHFAHSDLKQRTEQHYWTGADQSNIDQIVREEATKWLSHRAA